MTDIADRLRKTKPREVCEHGSQRVKCPICELAEAEAEIEQLRDALQSISEAVEPYKDTSALSRAVFVTARKALEVKND